MDEDFSRQTRRFSREAPQGGAFSAKPPAGRPTAAILTDCKGNRRSMAGKRPARRRSTVVNTGSYNTRLAAIRAFMEYAAGRDIALAATLEKLKKISFEKPVNSHIVEFMSMETVSAIVEQTDVSSMLYVPLWDESRIIAVPLSPFCQTRGSSHCSLSERLIGICPHNLQILGYKKTANS